MENIKIAKVCGLCAGCKRAIDTAVNEIESGKKVTIFKEIVHNKNVNSYLESIGAKCEENIENLKNDNVIIIRAHGEPPETYDYFEKKGFEFRDCTCPNVTAIHDAVQKYSNDGYKVIVIGKHKKAMHPEVLGTTRWAKTEAILIETIEDVEKIKAFKNEKFYLVCQTTFNMKKTDELIDEIEKVTKETSCELIINKSLCSAQKTINEFSAELAKQSDVMIVVGGSNSSNSIELFKNVSSICPSIFIEDIYSYKDALKDAGLEITRQTRVGITAGASTRKEELVELKKLIENDLKN
jgi:4-hydroxy-3-methylbut-2-enyl diphosphate reductase